MGFDIATAKPVESGFDLSSARPKSAVDRFNLAAKDPSLIDELIRGTGATARTLIHGVSAIPGVMADAATGVVNQFLPENKRFLKSSVAIDNLLNSAGVGNLQGAPERILGDTLSAVTGAGGLVKASQKGGQAILASQPVQQLLAAGGGSLASSATREGGGGPVAQTVAGLVGGFTPVGATALSRMNPIKLNLTQAQRDIAKGKILNAAAGTERPGVVAGLNNPKVLVPGEVPTSALAASEANSPAFSAVEKLVTKKYAPELMAHAKDASEAARLAALKTVGRDKAALAAAEGTRASNSAANYGVAFQQSVKGDPQLAVLASNPFFKKALPSAFELAAHEKITPSSNLTRFLHITKLSLDKMLTKTGDTALSNAEKRAVSEVKTKLVQWLANKNPQYEAARSQFAADSIPINQMNIGQYLEGKLISPLAGNERAGSFAQALRDAPGTIKRSVGGPRFETLGQAGVTPNQQGLLKGIQDSLAREANVSGQASLGTQRAGGLLGNEVGGTDLPNWLSKSMTLARYALEHIGVKTMNKTLSELARDMQDPAISARLMRTASAPQRAAILDIIKAGTSPGLLQPMSQVQ